MWWLTAAAVLIVVEIFTNTFVLLMLGIGALAAAAVAAVGLDIPAQLLAFAAVSGLTLYVLRPRLKHRFFQQEDEPLVAGLSTVEGSRALVLERVDEHNGLVKIDGELWRARPAEPGASFEPGEQVFVSQVDGATALIRRV